MADDPDPAQALDAKHDLPVNLPALLARPFPEVERVLLNRIGRHGDELGLSADRYGLVIHEAA